MRAFLLIFAITVFLVVLNLPASFTIAKRTFSRPNIDLSLGGQSFRRNLDLTLGLDLQGGSHLVFEADTSKLAEADRPKALEAARNNIERRVNLLGVSEPIIQSSKVGNSYRLIVELAAITDLQQALQTIGQTAQLDFRESSVATPSGTADFHSTGLTGADLKLAQVEFNSSTAANAGQPVVSLEFNAEGAKKFADITARNVGRALPVFLDDQLVTAPVVQTAIADGRAVISGSFTVDEAKRLSIQLNAGALPVPIKVVEQRSIGATLGRDSIIKSLVAGLIGLFLVWVFMAVNYGVLGLVADFALGLYVLLSLAIIRLVPITLTLAGIAGLILSIGMAVDANILIFERIKEELHWGRSLKAAYELGFLRAWSSIRDSNASTLITAFVLFWFGSGSVRGFALTLAVGVGASLFTAITITKSLLRLTMPTKKA